MHFMYASGAVAHPPKTENFIPELNTLHYLLCATLTLRIGDATACPQYERNLIQFYVQKKPFSIFDFILHEIISISRNTLRSCGYAPQIMMIIEKVTGIDFIKDKEITMDVPSTLAAPRSTRSGTAAPPPSTSSSSFAGILRVLKSMFAWCCDTCQRQDVLCDTPDVTIVATLFYSASTV
jgi:hypothetical protein